MKKQIIVTLVILVITITGISLNLIAGYKDKQSKNLLNQPVKENPDGCKCYANGNSYSPGSNACLGGYQARCIAKSGVGEEARNCGWDYLKDANGNYIRCN